MEKRSSLTFWEIHFFKIQMSRLISHHVCVLSMELERGGDKLSIKIGIRGKQLAWLSPTFKDTPADNLALELWRCC